MLITAQKQLDAATSATNTYMYALVLFLSVATICGNYNANYCCWRVASVRHTVSALWHATHNFDMEMRLYPNGNRIDNGNMNVNVDGNVNGNGMGNLC